MVWVGKPEDVEAEKEGLPGGWDVANGQQEQQETRTYTSGKLGSKVQVEGTLWPIYAVGYCTRLQPLRRAAGRNVMRPTRTSGPLPIGGAHSVAEFVLVAS